jgi:hypothetical protein
MAGCSKVGNGSVQMGRFLGTVQYAQRLELAGNNQAKNRAASIDVGIVKYIGQSFRCRARLPRCSRFGFVAAGSYGLEPPL